MQHCTKYCNESCFKLVRYCIEISILPLLLSTSMEIDIANVAMQNIHLHKARLMGNVFVGKTKKSSLQVCYTDLQS